MDDKIMNQVSPATDQTKQDFQALLEYSKKLEQQLNSLQRKLSICQKVDRLAKSNLTIGGILSNCLEFAQNEYNYRMGGIYLFEHNTEDLVLAVQNNLKDDFHSRVVEHNSENKKVFVTRFQMGPVLAATLPTTDSLLNKFIKSETQVKSIILAAIKAHQKLVGILCLADERSLSPGNRELESLTPLCSFLGFDIENFQLDSTLDELKSRYDLLLDNTLSGIFILQDRHFVYANDRFARIHGYSHEEILKIDVRKLEWPLDLQGARGHNIEIKKKSTGDLHYECKGVNKAGNVVWLEMKAAFVKYQGKQAIMGSVIDVTHQKLLEEEFDRSQKRYHFLFEKEKDAILLAYPKDTTEQSTQLHPSKYEQFTDVITFSGQPVEENQDKKSWIFEYFKKETVGEMNMMLYQEIMNSSEQDSTMFFRLNSHNAMIGVLKSEAEHQKFEDYFFSSVKNSQMIMDALPFSLIFYNHDLNFLWANKLARQNRIYYSQTNLNCAEIYPFCKKQSNRNEAICPTCNLKRALDTGRIQTDTLINDRKDIVFETVIPVRSEKNRVNYVVVMEQTIEVDTLFHQTEIIKGRPQTDEKASAILDSATDAIVAIDEEGTVVIFNSAAENLFGWDMKDLVGQSITHSMQSLPESYKKIFHPMLAQSEMVEESKIPDRIVIEMVQKKNTILSMEWSYSKAAVRGKRIIFAFGRDITKHKQMETELTVKNDFLENIIKFNPYGVEVFDTKGNLIHSNAAADYIYGFKSLVNYCIFDDLALVESSVIEKIQKAFAGEIVTVGPLWYETSKSGYEGIPSKKVCVRITFAPVHGKDGKIINVVAIHEDETRRKQIETELNASERRFQEVVETAMDGIFRVDSTGLFSFANPMMVEISGYSLEELIGLPFKEIVSHKSVSHLAKLFDITFKGAFTYKDELIINRKDGREVTLEISVVPIKKNNEVCELQALCRDISDHKKAEQALRESKELYSVLVEQSNDGVVLIRDNGTLTFVNDGLCQLFKYNREELIDQKFIKFLTRESCHNLATLKKNFGQEQPLPNNFELQVFRKDGKLVSVEIYAKKVQVHEQPIFMVHLRDVSERKKTEEKIRILSTAVESSEDGVFVTDTSGELIFTNKALAQMFGYSRDQLMNVPWEDLYCPASLELIEKEIFPLVFTGNHWNGELTALRQTKEVFPILLTISPIFKDDGQQLGAVGISKDITERKIIEEELRKKNQFLEKIIDLNPYGVQILDADSRTVRVNKAFEKMFFPLITATNMMNLPLNKNSEFQQLLAAAFDGKAVSHSPIWINLKEIDEKVKENRTICTSLVLFPIIDERKLVANVVGLYEDITERERASEEIERHNRELTALYEAGQAMVSIRDPRELIRSILKGAVMAAGTEFGAYFTYSKETNIFRLSTTIGFSDDHLERIYKNFNGALKNGEAVVYWHGTQRNALTPVDMKKATELMSPENVFKSALWVPVMYEERLLGVFNLFSKTPDAFGEDSIQVVTMFADQAAVALENARLYTELSKFAEEMELKIIERTRELVASEAKFRSIVENSPDLISIENLESKTLFGNTAFFTKLSYQPEEAAQIGTLQLLHPDDFMQNKNTFEELAGGKAIRNLECRYRCKNGNLLYSLVSAEKLSLNNNEVILFVARDITEKRQLEVNLKKSKEHHRALIDNVKDGVYTLKNNKLVWCNEQLAEIFKYDLEELQNSYVAKLFADQADFLNYEQELYFALAEKGHYRSEFKGKKKTGENFDLECSVSLIEENEDHNASEALVIVRDITEQKRMQEKLIQSERLAATGKLAASIAHEINNPLQGIMASLAAVKLKLKEDSKQYSGLDIVETGLKRIGNIVKQLLSLHRPERQEKHWTDLNLVVDEVVSLMQSQLSIHKITIKKSLSESLPKIYASSQQLTQILLNLILNAQESMPNGGEIRIFTRRKDKNVIIKIIDTGIGIESHELSNIFDPFHSTKQKMGTGLGLSVVHGAIEAHEGKIEVQSEVNKGTEFTIYLPIKAGE